jgi:hypothetical protein
MRRLGASPAAEPDSSGHKPGLISNDARNGRSAEGRLHLGNVGHEALGGALVRPQKRRGRQWVDFARVLNLQSRFGDQGLGLAFAAPPGAVVQVRTLAGDLDTTPQGSQGATPGRHVSPGGVINAEPAENTASANAAGRGPIAGVRQRSRRTRHDPLHRSQTRLSGSAPPGSESRRQTPPLVTRQAQRPYTPGRTPKQGLISLTRSPRFVDVPHPPMKQANLRR